MDEPIPGAEPEEHDEPAVPGAAAADVTDREEGADATDATDGARPGPAAGLPDDGPRPLGLGTRPTGHAPVDAQLRRLEDADHLAVSGHLEVYEDVHRGLRETLTALDRPAAAPAAVVPEVRS